jgi:hypothetical protein
MDNLEFSILSERCAPDKRGHDGSVGADHPDTLTAPDNPAFGAAARVLRAVQ